MEDLISVVVPIYNVENYIKKCVDSILSQTYKNLEIILVDDGSPDNCPQICDEYAQKDSRIKVIHKENGGLSDARNAGIDISKGKFITFIDSDDYIEKDYVEVLYNSIKENASDMSIGSHKAIYDNGTILNKETGEKSVLDAKTVLERILYDENIDLSAWAKLYKTELFEEIRYPKERVFEDAATTYKLVDKSKKISIVSKSIYNYIIRNNSITNYKFTKKKMDLIISTQEMCEYIKNKYPDLEKACDRRLMYAYLSTLSQLAKSKEKFPEEQKQLTTYIKKNGKKILKDSRVPKRDKLGIISLRFGFKMYKKIWKIYSRISGRDRISKK